LEEEERHDKQAWLVSRGEGGKGKNGLARGWWPERESGPAGKKKERREEGRWKWAGGGVWAGRRDGPWAGKEREGEGEEFRGVLFFKIILKPFQTFFKLLKL
jgi:hypothetical protein